MVITIVVISVVALLGLGFLALRLVSGWTTVSCVDEFGKVESKEWVKNKKPDCFSSNGASHLREYVKRLAGSRAEFASVQVSALDHERGFLLMKRIGEPVLFGMCIDWRDEPEREQRARAFFAALNIPPESDYLAGNGGVSDATRVLDWPVGQDGDFIADLCDRALRELCEITILEGLEITFEDQPARRIKFPWAGAI